MILWDVHDDRTGTITQCDNFAVSWVDQFTLIIGFQTICNLNFELYSHMTIEFTRLTSNIDIYHCNCNLHMFIFVLEAWLGGN